MSSKRWNSVLIPVVAAFALLVGVPTASAQQSICACFYEDSEERNCEEYIGVIPNQTECNQLCVEREEDAQLPLKSSAFNEDKDSDSGTAIQNACAASGQSVAPAPTPSDDATAPTRPFITPRLSVDIPGVTFTDAINQQGGVLSVNFIGRYVTGVYQYLLGVATIFAIIMIMIGGVQYVLSRGSAGAISQAKDRMKNAVVGLVLLLSVYTILFTVNPGLTIFDPQRIAVVQGDPFLPRGETEDESVSGIAATALGTPDGENIVGPGKSTIAAELLPDIEAAAEKVEGAGLGLFVTSSFRSPEKQIELIRRNCQNPPGSATCNPFPGKPQTCILKDNDPKNCPHTTGRALDIWAAKQHSGGTWVPCVSQQVCLSNLQACFQNECQAPLIAAMREQGFCVLSSEPWHFEKPRMSRNCN